MGNTLRVMGPTYREVIMTSPGGDPGPEWYMSIKVLIITVQQCLIDDQNDYRS
jgi:hypothetical protein